MNILMVTSEAVPFSKSGGLADVLGSLSPALVKKGASVKVLMPLYSFIERKGFRKQLELRIPMLGGEEKASVLSRKLDGVEFLAIEHPWYTERKGIYGDTSFEPYQDNCRRFALLAESAALYLKESGWEADVVHAHDWPAGLVPFYLEKHRIKAKTVFTIHNLAYQGDFSRYDAVLTGDRFPEECFKGSAGSERLNMLQSALLLSDRITTVSPTYAKEIQTEKFGCQMDPILRERKDDLYGILNGMDTSEWSPARDRFFPEHYSRTDLSGKAALKRRLQQESGLEVNDGIPLFAMISRIADQKGYAELLGGNVPILGEILKMNLQVVIVGTGDRHYEEKLEDMAALYPNLSVHIAFSQKLSHEVEGGADFFLMPSRYEPCGLNQMYSLHYGTLPVAHRTGGLADTIIDIDDDRKNGTGFLMNDLSSDSFMDAVRRAVEFYREDKEGFLKAQKRAMKEDFTWDRSAEEYIDLYTRLETGKAIR